MTQEKSVIIVPETPGAETIRVPVLKIFDGDGFLTRIKTCEITGNPRDQSEFQVTVRFGFVDAPEMKQPGGHEAKEFLATLIGDKWLELVVLTKMDTGQSVDRHGRIVCVPFLTQEYPAAEFRTSSNNLHNAETFGEPLLVTRNIELEMVLNGWAWVLERYGPDERYFEALADAQRHKRGIWALENNIEPWEFKRQKYRETQPSLATKTSTKCPMERCGGYLVKRNGKFGAFFGCSNFPGCRYACTAAV
ncbi:thermonuclease family protein [Sinorhizobium fredii]|uniref:thermonuclease family protein n=1 Tax=Rhizobium fredii TaxID=380 RepID=UPI0030A0E219